MKMFFVRGDETPTTGDARKRQPAVIPPFTFSGPLDSGDSGIWWPPRAIILTSVSVTCNWPGNIAAIFSIYRIEYGNQRSFLEALSLGALNADPPVPPEMKSDAKRAQFRMAKEFDISTTISPPTVSPFEGLMVRSQTSSGHENVVIQMLGEYL